LRRHWLCIQRDESGFKGGKWSRWWWDVLIGGKRWWGFGMQGIFDWSHLATKWGHCTTWGGHFVLTFGGFHRSESITKEWRLETPNKWMILWTPCYPMGIQGTRILRKEWRLPFTSMWMIQWGLATNYGCR
jgi:hypothetical protein